MSPLRRLSISLAVSLGVLVPSVALADTILYAPTVPQPSGSSDIVGLILQNTTAVTEAAGYVTFGEVFKQGSVQRADSLVARINGTNYPVQMDVKATHVDGSVRHAVITFKAPSIAANSSVSVMLAKGSATLPSPTAPSISTLISSGYNLSTVLTFTVPNTAVATINAATTLQGATSPQLWLAGPLVNEWRVQTTANSSLIKITFDIRAYADGTTRTDIIYGNDWFFTPGKSDLTYSVAIAQNNMQVYSYANIYQYLYSLWHREVDSAGIVSPNIQYDIPYLIKTGAIQNYDLSYGASNTNIQNDLSALAIALPIYSVPTIQTRYGPMGAGLVAVSMGAVGGRVDIGPQPNWMSQWIVSQNADARKVMMANADVASVVPWNMTDENTGEPISQKTYQKFALYQTGVSYTPKPANGWPKTLSSTQPWGPDEAHMPDLSYLPYLVTGSHFRLDALKTQANFVLVSSSRFYQWDDCSGQPVDPTNPGAHVYMGPVACNSQTRGQAWALRQLSEAAYLVPDADQSKSYFTSELADAMNGYIKLYLTDAWEAPSGEIKGFIKGINLAPQNNGVTSGPTAPAVAPWQTSYLMTSLGLLSGLNMPQVSSQATQMLSFAASFFTGLFLNGANGYNPYNGVGYYLFVKNATTTAPVTTWGDLQSMNVYYYTLNTSGWGLQFADPTSLGGFPTSAEGYPELARSALANIITHAPSVEAQQAYDWLDNEITKAIDAWVNHSKQSIFSAESVWNIIPTGTVSATYPQVSLGASASSITSGGSVTLSWSSTNTTSCTGTGFTAAATAGSVTVTPTVTTTYSITCTGSGGTSIPSSVTVTVATAISAPTATLTASPTSITAGQSSTLKWSSTNATSCTGTGFSTGGLTSNSTGVTVTPSVTTTYSITCTGTGGTSLPSSVTITTTPLPTVSLSASPTSITTGGSSLLTWSSTNATTCTGTGFPTGNAAAGSVSLSPLATTLYALTCTGTGGTASASTTVTVTAAPPPSPSSSLIQTITTSGDFSQTNTCSTVTASGQSCTVSVLFTPTLSGTRMGTLSFKDMADGTTHTVVLSGTGLDVIPPTATTPPPTGTPPPSSTPPPAPSSTLSQGLAGYWNFDASTVSGTSVTDVSGNGKNGTLKFFTTNPIVPGKIAEALQTGTANYQQVTLPNIPTGSTFTFSAWVNVSAIGGSSNDSLASEPTGTNSIVIHGESAHKISYHYAGADHVSNASVPLGAWTLVTVVVDNGALTYYLNGAPDSATYAGAPSMTLGVLGATAGAWPLIGLLDDVRLYSRALSASEVGQLYTAGSAGKVAFSHPSLLASVWSAFTSVVSGVGEVFAHLLGLSGKESVPAAVTLAPSSTSLDFGTVTIGQSATKTLTITTGTGGGTVTPPPPPPPPTGFRIGATIQTTAKLNIRTLPTVSSKRLCTQAKGALGTIVAGPTLAGGYTWWTINYDRNCDGWSAEAYLQVIQ